MKLLVKHFNSCEARTLPPNKLIILCFQSQLSYTAILLRRDDRFGRLRGGMHPKSKARIPTGSIFTRDNDRQIISLLNERAAT